MNLDLSLFLIASGWLLACMAFAGLTWLSEHSERSRRIHAARNRVHVYAPLLCIVTPLQLGSSL